MLVISYLSGIPAKNKNPEKPAVLKNFIKGVNIHGRDRGVVTTDTKILDCDVAVLQGFVHEKSQNVPHLQLRKNVLSHQVEQGKKTIIIDSNLFLYRDLNNSKKYLRYSYNGVFPTTGEYCNSIVDGVQWQKIKQDLGIELKPWNLTNQGHVLICAQRDGGWSMDGKRVVQWIKETVAKIRRETDRPIKLRMHPGDSNNDRHLRVIRQARLNIQISNYQTTTLLDDLQGASAVVVYNSSPAVAAAIEGVPVFVTDPTPLRSQAYDVAHVDLKDLRNPNDFDREQWIEKIAQMHWNQKDLIDGRAWNWMRRWAN